MLERAIALVAERQEVLRAYFVEDDGRPSMRITDDYLGRLEHRQIDRRPSWNDGAAQQLIAELTAEPST